MTRRRTVSRAISAGLAAGLVGAALLGPAGPAAAVANPEQDCAVGTAELRWGVKERFRNYISGSIANGEWITEGGASYETPTFIWQGGTGDISPELTHGLIAFNGTVQFTGHGGAMQLDLQNPVIEFRSATSARLILDMASRDTEGTQLELQPVVAAAVDLSGADTEGDTYMIADAPVRLTAEGAAAFNGAYGDYAIGERMDALTLSFSLPGCSITAATGTAAPQQAEPGPGEGQDPGAESSGADVAPEVPWLLIGLGAAALIAIGVTTGMLVAGSRKKPAHPGGETGDSAAQDPGAQDPEAQDPEAQDPGTPK